MILWTPPWNVPALKNLAPRALTYLSALPDEGGRRLILIDDLHYWLESVREYGESSGELPLPDGYPYTARRQLGELLDLKSLPMKRGVPRRCSSAGATKRAFRRLRSILTWGVCPVSCARASSSRNRRNICFRRRIPGANCRRPGAVGVNCAASPRNATRRCAPC